MGCVCFFTPFFFAHEVLRFILRSYSFIEQNVSIFDMTQPPFMYALKPPPPFGLVPELFPSPKASSAIHTFLTLCPLFWLPVTPVCRCRPLLLLAMGEDHHSTPGFQALLFFCFFFFSFLNCSFFYFFCSKFRSFPCKFAENPLVPFDAKPQPSFLVFAVSEHSFPSVAIFISNFLSESVFCTPLLASPLILESSIKTSHHCQSEENAEISPCLPHFTPSF